MVSKRIRTYQAGRTDASDNEERDDILFHLSLYESEQGISNNSRGVWSGFFSVMLSDTELPFNERFELLLRRMKEWREEWDTTGFESAMECVLSPSGVKIGSLHKISGRITPESWMPKDQRELIDIHCRILLQLREAFDTLLPKLRGIILAKLMSHMHFFYVLPELRTIYFDTISAMAATCDANVELLIQIASECDHLQILCKDEADDTTRKAYKDQIAVLEAWQKELADERLEARLRIHISGNSFSASKEERRQMHEQMAEELLRCEDCERLLASLLNYPGIKDYEMGYFAETLGLLDADGKLKSYALRLLAKEKSFFSEEYFNGFCQREGVLSDTLRAEFERYLDSASVSVLRITMNNAEFTQAVLNRIAEMPAEWARRYNYEFIKIMEAMPDSCLQTCVELVAGIVDFSATDYQNSEQIAFIARELDHIKPQPVIFLLCDHLYEEFLRFPWGTSYKALVSSFSPEVLLEWIGKDEERAKAIAFHLPSPRLDSVDIPPVTKAFMETYGQSESVLKQFHIGIHSFAVVSYDELEKKVQVSFAFWRNTNQHIRRNGYTAGPTTKRHALTLITK